MHEEIEVEPGIVIVKNDGRVDSICVAQDEHQFAFGVNASGVTLDDYAALIENCVDSNAKIPYTLGVTARQIKLAFGRAEEVWAIVKGII